MDPVITENKKCDVSDTQDIFLPTDELRSALHRALTTEKSRALSEEDLAQVDKTVSRYLEQQLKLNALRARGADAETINKSSWRQAWWLQLAAGATVFLLAGYIYLYQLNG